MGASIRLCKILGIPVSLHFSWFIVFFLFTALFWRHFDQSWSTAERWIAAFATSLLLFLSVLAHELSHSLIARRNGIPVKGITLFIFGGVSQIAREANRPSTELIIAVVGPISSIALAFLFAGLAVGLEDVNDHLSVISWTLMYVNIALGVFNMLPAYPMDGGRVLRAAIWQITRNYRRATRLAAAGGQIIALTMIAAGISLAILDIAGVVRGLWLLMIQLMVIGIFLHAVASASHRRVRLQEELDNCTARDVMTTNCPVAPDDVTLGQLMDDYFTPSGSDFIVLTREGRAQGIVMLQLMDRVREQHWRQQRAMSVMLPLEMMALDWGSMDAPQRRSVAIGPEEAAYNVMELMEGKNINRVLVLDRGVVLGFISRDTMKWYARAHARSSA